jgi:hypothetical protein
MFKISSSKNESNGRRDVDSVMVDYYPIDCVSAQIRMDEAADSATIISAGFSGKYNQPNIVYAGSGAPELYAANTIYLYGRIHDIDGLNYDGEMVVEHEWGNRKLFVCFPVKRGIPMVGAHGDPIETLVRASDPAAARIDGSFAELRLNDVAGSRAISYKSKDRRGMPCRVVVFLDVVRTSVDISGYSHSVRELFASTPEAAPTVLSVRRRGRAAGALEADDGGLSTALDGGAFSRSAPNNPQLVEEFSTTMIDDKKVMISDGFADDVLTCEYLPVGTETAQVFQIPIDTNIVADTAHQEMTSVALYFSMSILAAMFIFFIAPIIYGSAIADYFRQKLPDYLDFLNGWFMTSGLSWTDVILVGVMSFLAIVLTSAGMSSGKNPLKAAGIVILVMLFVGFFGIHISAKMGWRDANAHIAKSALAQ